MCRGNGKPRANVARGLTLGMFRRGLFWRFRLRFFVLFPHGFQDGRLLRRLFQPFQPGEGLLDGVSHGEMAGPVSLIRGGDGFRQLSHGLCLLYGFFPHERPARIFQVPPGLMVFRRHGFNLFDSLAVKLDGAFRGLLHGQKALFEMEETGQIVKGRRPALLEVRKSLLAAAYDVFF